MNQYVMIGIIIVAVLIVWNFVKSPATTGGSNLSLEDAKKKIDTRSDIILLDVRTKEEYLEKHIPKSALIPVDVLEQEAASKLPEKGKEILVYCRSGRRSATAVAILKKLGYTHVYDLGGIINWPYETVSGGK